MRTPSAAISDWIVAVKPPARMLLVTALLGAVCALAPASAGAAVTVTYNKGILRVEGDSRDNRVFAYCDATVHAVINGKDPASGPVGCPKVTEIDVLAGAGDDLIDMTGVGPRFGDADFSGFGSGTGVAVAGDDGDDVLVGSESAFNIFIGLRGNDRARGGPRRDVLVGGGGRDRLLGLGGRDDLFGNQKADKLFGGDGPDRLYGGKGTDKLVGGPGKDTQVQD